MKCAEEYMRLYAVTDRAWVGGQTLYQQVESALKGGVTVFSCGKRSWTRKPS